MIHHNCAFLICFFKDQTSGKTMKITDRHYVNNTRLTTEPEAGCEKILLGMGCFWGAERLFWQLDGVTSTSVGYAGGFTVNPDYEQVCTGSTGHAEVVRVIYDPTIISLESLLIHFWENHDPTQGMRQGNDVGTQYRSIICTYTPEQQSIAELTRLRYQENLNRHNRSRITTEIIPAKEYYYAEDYHQQYLAKNRSYCGLRGTGVCFFTD